MNYMYSTINLLNAGHLAIHRYRFAPGESRLSVHAHVHSNNYKLEPRSFNRSDGAKINETYQPPVKLDFYN